jgi:hypothetical protein
MTGDQGTGVKEIGDPCSIWAHETSEAKEREEAEAKAKANDDKCQLSVASAARGAGDAATAAAGSNISSVVEGEGGQRVTGTATTTTIEEGNEAAGATRRMKSGAGAEASGDAGEALRTTNEVDGGTVNEERAAAAAAESIGKRGDANDGNDGDINADTVEKVQAIEGHSEATKALIHVGYTKARKNDIEAGAPDTRAPVSASASLPPQVLSDAIVAAYQRGFELGYTASATAAVPQSPVASSSAAFATATTSSSPYRAGIVPSLVGSPMSLGGGGGLGYHLASPIGSSPYSMTSPGGGLHKDRQGVAFRMPSSRMDATLFGHREQMPDSKAADTHPYKSQEDNMPLPAAINKQEQRAAAGGSVGDHSGSSFLDGEGNGGSMDDKSDDDDDDDDDGGGDDDDSTTAKKRERARARANNRKGYIDMIASKKAKAELTEFERNELKSWEERRDRKNHRSRERSVEKKSRIRHILDTPADQRSDADAAFLREHLARRERKNEGDRLRRERIRKMAGCGPKPPGVTVTARGPIKLATGELVEREEDAAAAVLLAKKEGAMSNDASSGRDTKAKSPHKTQKKRTSSEAAMAEGPKPKAPAARVESRGVQLPPAFLPPVPSLSTQSAEPRLLPTMYPHYGVPLAPKAPYYAGPLRGGAGGGAYPSLMTMQHRMRGGVGGTGMSMSSLPYPPFYGGGAPPHGPVPNWAASSLPALHQHHHQGSHPAPGRAPATHAGAWRAADHVPAGSSPSRLNNDKVADEQKR